MILCKSFISSCVKTIAWEEKNNSDPKFTIITTIFKILKKTFLYRTVNSIEAFRNYVAHNNCLLSCKINFSEGRFVQDFYSYNKENFPEILSLIRSVIKEDL